MTVEDMVGKKYGMLTVLRQYYEKMSTGENRDFCDCICDCGNEKLHVLGKNIRRNMTAGCGCTRLDKVWEACHKVNEYYELEGNVILGVDYKGKEFYFSKNKYEMLKDYSWSVGNQGYAQTKARMGSGTIFMHNLIMGATKIRTVDHINRKRNDNRDENLRLITIQLNNINRERSLTNNTSGVIGVSRVSESVWHSYISNNGKRINHYFEYFHDAVTRRLELERDLYGEFAPQRHLFEEYGIEE
jgi:hypothetical protein